MRRGHPTFTTELAAKIVEAIRAGASRKAAAAAAGVSRRSLTNWMAHGYKDAKRPVNREFVLAVQAAEAEATEQRRTAAVELAREMRALGRDTLARWEAVLAKAEVLLPADKASCCVSGLDRVHQMRLQAGRIKRQVAWLDVIVTHLLARAGATP